VSKLVVDASVATKWLVAEALTDEALAILESDSELVAPDLFPIEIGNVLWKKVRAAELTAEQAVERFEGLGKMGLRIVATGSIQSQAIQLAMETGRTVYDSLYLALAVAEECGLVTADERFVNALRGTPYASRVNWLGTPAR
jgi:predicted nucleic acid-binding protein